MMIIFMSKQRLNVNLGEDFDLYELDQDLLSEGRYYEIAFDQLLDGDYDRNLWAACKAHCDFDEDRAKALYVSEASKLIESEHVKQMDIDKELEKEREEELIREELEEKVAIEESEKKRINEELEHQKNLDAIDERIQKKKEIEESEKEEKRKAKIQAWREGKGGHPDDVNPLSWAIYGAIITAVFLSAGFANKMYISLWISIPLGFLLGWICAGIINRARIKF